MPCLGCVWKKPKVTETGTATLNDDRGGLDGFVATRPQQAVIVTTATTPCCREGIDGDGGFACLGCSRSPFLGSLGFCVVDWENALIFEAGGLACQYHGAGYQLCWNIQGAPHITLRIYICKYMYKCIDGSGEVWDGRIFEIRGMGNGKWDGDGE